MHGRRPLIHPAATRQEELATLAERISAWLASGIEPSAIGVAARSSSLAHQASDALKAAGIPILALAAQGAKNAVRAGTMHGMKGLEFQAVAVIGVEQGTVPAPAALTPASEDPLAHDHDLQRERCVLFVACTRARDHLYVSYVDRPSPFLP
jgi:superfamily I DNA/RNA helicase